ncbi:MULTISPECIES: hypothetical protein [unclassified Micromonospora]|uniref:hypothetical protein n=1 Tax=Micromonospora TaxID=1873 RepID=UPI0024179D7F|nr:MULTISPECIES: hypothetical protein [unclassified Micromonospora]MDG4816057.1 hypothetical protein [Micromonospora sp. WMMD956]WFE58585.1 hypothetical protein O7633_17785 [Micromonospora sp. WMMD712]
MAEHISSNGRRQLRPILWLLLFVSITANAIASSVGTTASTVISVLFGVVALVCAGSLVVDHYRHRAQ